MCSCMLCSCVPSYLRTSIKSTKVLSYFRTKVALLSKVLSYFVLKVLSKVILSYESTLYFRTNESTKVLPEVLSYFRTKVSILLYFRTEVRTEVLSYFRTSSTVLLYFRPLPDRASRSNSALLPTDRAEAPEALMIGLAARVRFVFKQFLALHVRVRV